MKLLILITGVVLTLAAMSVGAVVAVAVSRTIDYFTKKLAEDEK